MTTSIRNGNCKVAEFSTPHLSQLLQEVGAFVAMLEGRDHGRYLVSHIEHHYGEDVEWWECSIFYDYFLEGWEELDLNGQTERVDELDALLVVGEFK